MATVGHGTVNTMMVMMMTAVHITRRVKVVTVSMWLRGWIVQRWCDMVQQLEYDAFTIDCIRLCCGVRRMWAGLSLYGGTALQWIEDKGRVMGRRLPIARGVLCCGHCAICAVSAPLNCAYVHACLFAALTLLESGELDSDSDYF